MLKYLVPLILLFSVQMTLAQIPERIKQPPSAKEMEDFFVSNLAALQNHKRKDAVKKLNFGRFAEPLKDFPKEIRDFVNVETLGITGPIAFQDMSQQLIHLSKLKNLHLDHVDFKLLADDVAKIKNLEELRIGTYTDVTTPKDLSNLKALKRLTISRLNNLNGEDLNHQSLVFPVKLGTLTNLKELRLFYYLNELPPGIGKLQDLEVLSARRNRLQSLPAEIIHLQNLKFLLLEENKLQTLPEDVYRLKNLENLYLDQNNLVSIPAGIGSLTNLKNFSIATNKISNSEFKKVFELKNLEELAAGNNEISDLREIEKLQNLKVLYLDSNQLESDDLTSLYNLPNLEKLHLKDNRISHFPNGLEKMKNLKELSIKGNPIPNSELVRIRKLLPGTQINSDY